MQEKKTDNDYAMTISAGFGISEACFHCTDLLLSDQPVCQRDKLFPQMDLLFASERLCICVK